MQKVKQREKSGGELFNHFVEASEKSDASGNFLLVLVSDVA
jgi:hypothetical protein